VGEIQGGKRISNK